MGALRGISNIIFTKTIMRKTIAVLIITVCIPALASCGYGNNESAEPSTPAEYLTHYGFTYQSVPDLYIIHDALESIVALNEPITKLTGNICSIACDDGNAIIIEAENIKVHNSPRDIATPVYAASTKKEYVFDEHAMILLNTPTGNVMISVKEPTNVEGYFEKACENDGEDKTLYEIFTVGNKILFLCEAGG